VSEAKAHLECEVGQVVNDATPTSSSGRIVQAHVDPSVWKDGRVDAKLLDPVCRLSGDAYASLGELFNVARSGRRCAAPAARRRCLAQCSGRLTATNSFSRRLGTIQVP